MKRRAQTADGRWAHAVTAGGGALPAASTLDAPGGGRPAAQAQARPRPAPGNPPQRSRRMIRPAASERPNLDEHGGLVAAKDPGALPRTPALPRRSALDPIISSPGQAEPYARTPGAGKGSLRSASGRPLPAPENRTQPKGARPRR